MPKLVSKYDFASTVKARIIPFLIKKPEASHSYREIKGFLRDMDVLYMAQLDDHLSLPIKALMENRSPAGEAIFTLFSQELERRREAPRTGFKQLFDCLGFPEFNVNPHPRVVERLFDVYYGAIIKYHTELCEQFERSSRTRYPELAEMAYSVNRDVFDAFRNAVGQEGTENFPMEMRALRLSNRYKITALRSRTFHTDLKATFLHSKVKCFIGTYVSDLLNDYDSRTDPLAVKVVRTFCKMMHEELVLFPDVIDEIKQENVVSLSKSVLPILTNAAVTVEWLECVHLREESRQKLAQLMRNVNLAEACDSSQTVVTIDPPLSVPPETEEQEALNELETLKHLDELDLTEITVPAQ